MGMFTVQTQFSKAKTNSYGDCFESRKYNKINSSPLRLQSSKMERELIFNIWIKSRWDCGATSVWPLRSLGDNTQFQILQIQFIAKQSGKYSPIQKLILSTTEYSTAYKIQLSNCNYSRECITWAIVQRHFAFGLHVQF